MHARLCEQGASSLSLAPGSTTGAQPKPLSRRRRRAPPQTAHHRIRGSARCQRQRSWRRDSGR
eukprot:2498564-Prorocentrum_lima.AAC.1